ncbi:nesprin-2 [Aulostomus maculatus]
MPGVEPPPPDRHGGAVPSSTEGPDHIPEEELRGMEQILDLSESPMRFTPSSWEWDGEDEDVSWSRDGDLQGLEQRWILWHGFMKEHAHLDAWLRLAEQAVTSQDPAHITYLTAKEELRKFERLCSEAGSRLVQLDRLTHRNRMLTPLFQGAMQARLLMSARDCGLRWDEVNAKLDSITGRLKRFVSEWEEFEAEREELSLRLADLDVRLMEIHHMTGNTCEKLRLLQSFQQCVCVNSGRVSVLLQRGEALIQRSEATDAQHVESQLLELLQRCNHVYSNIARTHTWLLSMRLVFEDDGILSPPPDSGCPSESFQEEEGALDKALLDLPVLSNLPEDSASSLYLPPPSPASPSHEHQGLEWDPSVDIGRSVSRNDADSSYFSACTGLCHMDGLKTRSYLSSLGSQSDISNDVTNQEAELQPEQFPISPGSAGTRLSEDLWVTSTPDRHGHEPASFDGGRVTAWLRFQSPAPPDRGTSCSEAVQTDGQVKGSRIQLQARVRDRQSCHDNTHNLLFSPSASLSLDLGASPDWVKAQYQPDPQPDSVTSRCEEAKLHPPEQSVTSSSGAPSSRLSPALLYFLLAASVALLACLILGALEPPCHRSSRRPPGFHLRYVNGPPPT